MKEVSQEKLIELLKNKENTTYKELAELTGYHPKSLIRLNSKLKRNNYVIEEIPSSFKNEIINNYLKSSYKSYKDFYDNELNYKISYSLLCKIFKNVKTNEDIVFVKKIKDKGKYYFEIIDYRNESLLFCFESLKNDERSFKKIFYLILNNFGSPNNICFVNIFKDVPLDIKYLLDKYNVNLLTFKSVYRNIFSKLSKNRVVNYRKINIDNEDFYNSRVRKTINDNIIQFENVRYIIKSSVKIKKNEVVKLYYNDQKNDIFIKYKGAIYKLDLYKNIESKRGNSKYN